MATAKGYCQCGCGNKTRISDRTDHQQGWTKGEPRRYLRGHCPQPGRREVSPYEAERQKLAPSIEPGFCWCGCGGLAGTRGNFTYMARWKRGEYRRYLPGHHIRPTGPEYVAENHGYVTPCWIWQRSIGTHGYGVLGDGGKAHREYYERSRGSIPEGLQIDHLCRVKVCVNPEHLEVVTQTENVRRGNACKISKEDVREIRQCADAGVKQAVLAERFGISESHCSRVINRVWWADV